MKTSWMKLKSMERIVKSDPSFPFFFLLFYYSGFFFEGQKWNYHLRIVFEWCHEMFLNTSKYFDHFYHWTNFAHTKQSEAKKSKKRVKKMFFGIFVLKNITTTIFSHHAKFSTIVKNLAQVWSMTNVLCCDSQQNISVFFPSLLLNVLFFF